MKFVKTPFPSSFRHQGEIYITYRELEKIFGRPYHGPGKEDPHPQDFALVRCTCQWRLKYEDGTIAMIYDQRKAVTPMEAFRWTIGGDSGKVVQLVNDTVNEYRKNQQNNAQ